MSFGTSLLDQAKRYEQGLSDFMRELIAIPGESSHEGAIIARLKQEMEAAGFDEVIIDKMGNIMGRVGNGKRVIAMDAHVDTVGVGSRAEWKWDPFEGKLENGIIYGRGASDQRAGMVSMIYGVRIMRDLGLLDDFTLYVVGSVQEEDCDGLNWQYIYNEDGLRPDCVVITEATDLNVYRGHRGRMEIGITTYGVSCHGSAPERGRNAVYMMAKVVNQIEELNTRIQDHDFLGKGTVTVSFISCQTPSMCAVPNESYCQLDRRLTMGETKESAVAEVEDAVRRTGLKAGEYKVEVLNYDRPSYTGLSYPTEKYYPTWVLPEEHVVCQSAIATSKELFGGDPVIGKWVFSTNGVSTMGRFGIPTVGFGPANEIYAHSCDDQVPVDHLVKAAAWYALFPKAYVNAMKKEMADAIA